MTVTDKPKGQRCHRACIRVRRPRYRQTQRSVCEPTGKNEEPINLSPNSEMVHFICNTKALGILRASTAVTLVCPNGFSDQDQNSAIILGGSVHK